MPSIKKGESEADYVKRCIPYVIHNEGASPEHAAAKCHGMYKEHKKKGTQYVELYEEGMQFEEDKWYAFKFNGETVNEGIKIVSSNDNGFRAVVDVGNTFKKGIFFDENMLSETFARWNNTLHDMNHMGSGYKTGLTVIPSDISYIVGWNNNAQYDPLTKEVSVNINIDENAYRYNEFKSYIDICNKANRTPNVSTFVFGKLKYIKAKNLPNGSNYHNFGYDDDDLVPYMTKMIPYMVSTVTRGACDDKAGCGIRLKNSCDDNSCLSTIDEQPENTNPEITKRRVYLEGRLKNIRG